MAGFRQQGTCRPQSNPSCTSPSPKQRIQHRHHNYQDYSRKEEKGVEDRLGAPGGNDDPLICTIVRALIAHSAICNHNYETPYRKTVLPRPLFDSSIPHHQTCHSQPGSKLRDYRKKAFKLQRLSAPSPSLYSSLNTYSYTHATPIIARSEK